MSYNFRVHIHLGAHKTASTFIQGWLARHQAFLKANRVAYIPLPKLRDNFTSAFWQAVKEEDFSVTQAEYLRSILFTEAESCGFDLNQTDVFVLSEENLLGSLAALHSYGVLYPALAERMILLGQLFADFDVRAFLSIRDYAEFYPSAYAERLRHGYIKTFDDYIKALDLDGNSWTSIITTIESMLGPVSLWPYETFRDNAHQVLSALLDTKIAANNVNADGIIRKSLTHKGLQVAMSCRDVLTHSEMKQLVNLLIEKMVFDPPNPKITLTNAELINSLHEKYQTDRAVLSDRFLPFGATL